MYSLTCRRNSASEIMKQEDESSYLEGHWRDEGRSSKLRKKPLSQCCLNINTLFWFVKTKISCLAWTEFPCFMLYLPHVATLHTGTLQAEHCLWLIQIVFVLSTSSYSKWWQEKGETNFWRILLIFSISWCLMIPLKSISLSAGYKLYSWSKIASSTLLDNTLTVKLHVSAQDIQRETVRSLQQEKILCI